jgi:hypothetical protein
MTELELKPYLIELIKDRLQEYMIRRFEKLIKNNQLERYLLEESRFHALSRIIRCEEVIDLDIFIHDYFGMGLEEWLESYPKSEVKIIK